MSSDSLSSDAFCDMLCEDSMSQPDGTPKAA